ncbi:hypothetical protein ACFL0F_01660 [Patescibacteria group bacterium]
MEINEEQAKKFKDRAYGGDLTRSGVLHYAKQAGIKSDSGVPENDIVKDMVKQGLIIERNGGYGVV